MTKSVAPNLKKWTTDDRRLLVIILLLLIYPVFVTSFFALYIFVLMPIMIPLHLTFKGAHNAGWYHFYWLFVSLLWLLLCFLIFPFFKKKDARGMIDLDNIEDSQTQPVKIVKAEDKKGSLSNLSQKSKTSCEDEKEITCDVRFEKEHLRKSRESLPKTPTPMDRKALTQSGELLSDCMSTIQSNIKESETVCEVHTEGSETSNDEEKVDVQEDQLKKKKTEDKPDKDDTKTGTKEDFPPENKENFEKASDTDSVSSDDNRFVETEISPQTTKNLQTSTPLKINDAMIEQHDGTLESEMTEEVGKLEEITPLRKREKVKPTIDTSRASGYYECSMPTPKSVDSQGTQNNTVFLFINPDNSTTADSILVSHAGEVEDTTVGKEP